MLDRLERRGFITRHPDEVDGRRVRVRATESGATRIGQYFVGMMTRLDELNSEYSTSELRLVAEYQSRAAETQEEEARRLVSGDDAD